MYLYLLSSSLIANFADSLFGPLYAVYVAEIGGSLLDVGNSMALYSIVTGVLIIFFGKLSDHYSKEFFATVGLLLSALGNLGYLFVTTPLHLYILQVLFAISTALLTAPFTALMAEHISKKQAGLMWALEGGGSRILFGIGLMFGTYLTYQFGFSTVFVLMFSLQIISTIILGRMYLLSK